MHIAFQAMIGIEIAGIDGRCGALRDLLLEGDSLHIRYLDVAMAEMVGVRRVLLATEAVQRADWPRGVVNVNLTREQVQESPDVNQHQPLPRQKELELIRHFGWQPYWSTSPVGVSDATVLPTPSVPVRMRGRDANLWNAQELIRYGVRVARGEAGYVEDLIVDDQTWTVHALVVDVQSRVAGRRVLITPGAVDVIDCEQRCVRLLIGKQDLNRSPEFKPALGVNRDRRDRRFDYYGRRRKQPATRS